MDVAINEKFNSIKMMYAQYINFWFYGIWIYFCDEKQLTLKHWIVFLLILAFWIPWLISVHYLNVLGQISHIQWFCLKSIWVISPSKVQSSLKSTKLKSLLLRVFGLILIFLLPDGQNGHDWYKQFGGTSMFTKKC